FFSQPMPPRPSSTPFPYTTLFRSEALIRLAESLGAERIELANTQFYGWALHNRAALMPTKAQLAAAWQVVERERARLGTALEIVDRKSTRLNSSHVSISYAVFCLK